MIRLKRGVLVLLVISCVCCIICQWSGVRRRDALEGDQCSTGADNAGQLATADQADVKDAAACQIIIIIVSCCRRRCLILATTNESSDASTTEFVAGSTRSVSCRVLKCDECAAVHSVQAFRPVLHLTL